jgi:hypothetical protein
MIQPGARFAQAAAMPLAAGIGTAFGSLSGRFRPNPGTSG